MNRNIAGFYHDPPLWVGSNPVVMGSRRGPNFDEFSELMVTRTLSGGIDFSVSRDGLFAFDFSRWPSGHFDDPTGAAVGDFEQTAELMLSQASVMNSLLVFLYTNELKSARFNRDRMVVTPELRIPLSSLDGPSDMGFGNQAVAHLVMSRFASSYRPGLPVSMDGRIAFRGNPVSTETVGHALDDLSAVISSGDQDGLGLLELFLRAGKAYQDHNHASAVITYWSVIERLLQELWATYQSDNQHREGSVFISGERRKRLNDGRTFTAAVITESLSFAARLPMDLYSKLNQVRKIRNDWMHGMKLRVSGAEARIATEACEGMLKLVRSIEVLGPQGLRLHG